MINYSESVVEVSGNDFGITADKFSSVVAHSQLPIYKYPATNKSAIPICLEYFETNCIIFTLEFVFNTPFGFIIKIKLTLNNTIIVKVHSILYYILFKKNIIYTRLKFY